MSYIYIYAPSRLEAILWKIPKYGDKRRLQYTRDYFHIYRFIALCTGFYNPILADIDVQRYVMSKLSLGQFAEIENMLLEHFQNKLNLVLKRQAAVFICTKRIENLGVDNA